MYYDPLGKFLKSLEKIVFFTDPIVKIKKALKLCLIRQKMFTTLFCVCYASSFMKCLSAEFAHTQTECARAIAKISGRV